MCSKVDQSVVCLGYHVLATENALYTAYHQASIFTTFLSVFWQWGKVYNQMWLNNIHFETNKLNHTN